MAYALLEHTAKEGSSSTVTTTAIDTTGATLIVLVLGFDYLNAAGTGWGGTTISDSQSNTWSLAGLGATQNNTRSSLIAFCPNPATNASHTFTVNGDIPSVCVLAFSGTAGALEKIVTNTGASVTSLSPGSITPTQDNELFVASLCLPTTSTASIGGGFTISDQVGGTIGQKSAAAYLIQTAAAAAAPSWTFTSNSGAATMVAFRLGSSGGGAGGSWAFS